MVLPRPHPTPLHGAGGKLCVFVTVAKNTALSGRHGVLALGVGTRGQRRGIQAVLEERRQQRRQAWPHLLAGVEVMVAAEAGPLLGRVNKTDGPGPGVIKDETWIHLRQSRKQKLEPPPISLSVSLCLPSFLLLVLFFF